MKKLRIGFVGGGFVGQVAHLNNYYLNPNCQLVAIAEKREELRENLKIHYGFLEAYTDHLEMLREANIEAVVAITRRPQTGPIALSILQAGKHLLTEKPMAHTVYQAEKLVEEAKKNNVIYAVGYLRRFDEGVQEAKRLFDFYRVSNELGKIISIRAHCYGGESYCGVKAPVPHDAPYPEDLDSWAIAPEWLEKKWHEQYARFVNVFSHNINLLHYFLETDLRVSYSNLNNPLAGLLVFEQPEGYLVNLEVGECSTLHWDDSLEIFFEKGKITLRIPSTFMINVPSKVEVYKGGGVREELISPQLPWTWAFKNQADAFVENILSKRHHPASGETGLKDLRIIEECWKKFMVL